MATLALDRGAAYCLLAAFVYAVYIIVFDRIAKQGDTLFGSRSEVDSHWPRPDATAAEAVFALACVVSLAVLQWRLARTVHGTGGKCTGIIRVEGGGAGGWLYHDGWTTALRAECESLLHPTVTE